MQLFKRSSCKAMTLIEIMITMIIAIIVLSLGLATMMGYLPKQRLSASAQSLSGALEKAQIQAAKGLPVCLNFSNINSSGTVSMFIFPNDDETLMNAGNCTASYAGITSIGAPQVFKEGVKLASCTNSVADTCVMWIRKDGIPILCGTVGQCLGGTTGPTGCTSVGVPHQFILSTDKLDTGARSKEVEVTESGLVNTPKFGDKGYVTNVWAKAQGEAAATGTSCE